MRLWLESNHIDMDRIPMWPEIELREGQMRIERLTRWDEERENRMLGRPYTYMSGWLDLEHPISEELWETYKRNRGLAATSRALRELGRAGATVVHLKDSDQLMFLTSQRDIEHSQFESMQEQLRALLPGVTVTFVAGFDTVMHRKGPA